MRLFLGIFFDKEVSQTLALYQERFLSLGPWFRPVAPDQFHVTLKFFGEGNPDSVSTLVKKLEPVFAVQPLNVTTERLGYFPSRGPLRVIWAGLTGELPSLASEVGKALDSGSQKQDFKPHITLARVKEISRVESDAIRRVADSSEIPPISQRVSEVVLVQSTLTKQGPVYSSLHTFRLA